MGCQDINLILDFWFKKASSKNWYSKNKSFDQTLIKNWSHYYQSSLKGEFQDWKQTAKGRLALCLLWDQFPRNAFRGAPQAFITDSLALLNTKEAILEKQDLELEEDQRKFLYLPFMHSENIEDQANSVLLFQAFDQETLEFAVLHAKIINQFGRFPRRNQALGRITCKKEHVFLNSEKGNLF